VGDAQMVEGFCLPNKNKLVDIWIERNSHGFSCITHVEYSNNQVSNGKPSEEFENGVE